MPTSPISPKQIARARAAIESIMTEPAMIERTGVTTLCWISAVKMREMPIAGLPDFMRGRLWQFAFKHTEDVEPDDRLLVPSKGAYQAVGLGSPDTLEIQRKVFALHEGEPEVYRVITHHVTFRSAKTQQEIGPFPVTIHPVDRMAVMAAGEMSFTHQIIWKETAATRFDGPGGTKVRIGSGDQVVWGGIRSGVADLDYPQFYPAVNFTVSYFRDS